MYVTDIIYDNARSFPEKTALITPNEVLNFKQLCYKADQYAKFLHLHGIAHRHKVAISVSSQVLHLYVSLAIAKLGASQISLPVTEPIELREKRAKSLKLNAIITEFAQNQLEETKSLVLPKDISTLKLDHGFTKFKRSRDDIFLLLQSSGTTGEPKFSELSHDLALDRLRRYRLYFNTNQEDVFWPASKLDFVVAKQRAFHCLQVGAAVCLSEGMRISGAVIEFLNETSVTLACGTPSHLISLSKSSLNPLSLPKLRAFEARSAIVSEATRTEFKEKVTPNLYISYATNEAEVISIATPTHQVAVIDTVGVRTTDIEVEIVDQKDDLVPNGLPGRIRIRGSGVISSYLNNPAANLKSFKDGWFYPGDMGKFDGNQLIFLGRSDDMMIYDGMNIYPVEIENVLMKHPLVTEAAAFPLRHPRFQDIPVAAIVSEKQVPIKELLQYCNSHLGHKSPKQLIAFKEFPKNTMGNTAKGELRKYFLQPKSSTGSKKVQGHETYQKLTIKYKNLAPKTLNNLNAWSNLLSIQKYQTYDGSRDSKSAETIRAHEIAEFLTNLQVYLLHLIKVPVFRQIRILECKKTDIKHDSWEVIILPPDSKLVDRALFVEIFKKTHLIYNMMINADATSKIDQQLIFRKIQIEVIDKFFKFIGHPKSTFHILKAAVARDIPFRPIGKNQFQLGWGKNGTRILGSSTDKDPACAARFSSDKHETLLLLESSGLPVPKRRLVRTLEQVKKFSSEFHFPIVVKPNDAERGEGVTVDVVESHLDSAFKKAIKYSPTKTVLMEDQLNGVCHRLFVAKGQLLYAVKRLPMGFYCDGEKSVAELYNIEKEKVDQTPPWERPGNFDFDASAELELSRQGWTLSCVPPKGTFVCLKRIETTELGGVDENVTNVVHSENIDLAIRAAEVFGLEIAGIDLMSSDVSIAWYENGAAITELNYAPQLGVGAISRKFVDLYISRILRSDGRIPIEICIGGKAAWDYAVKRHKNIKALCKNAFLTSAKVTIGGGGKEVKMVMQGLENRVNALLLNPRTEHLIVVIQDDELLYKTIPFDRITKLQLIDEQVTRSFNPDELLAHKQIQELLKLFKNLANVNET